MRHSLYDAEHEDFRAMVRAWAEKNVVPFHDQWEKDGIVPREVWRSGGAQRLLGMDVEDCTAVTATDGYPVSKAWRDARVQSIYGGTNEIMKEIIGRSLGL